MLKQIAFGLFLLAIPFQNYGQDSPNVIIIFVDDLGYGDLGAFGHPTINTPNIDKLAYDGVKLTQFYSTSPVCSPSRAALLTGKYPIKTGIYGKRGVFFPDSDKGLSSEEMTISSFLKDSGYQTACIGKWHLGHLPEYLPNSHGFDYYFGIPYSNDLSPATSDWVGVTDFPPTPLMENFEIIEREPDQRWLTKRYTEKSIEFIEKNKDKKFFLYLAHTFPHVPLFTSPKFENKSPRGLYGDVVEELDWSVGEVMKTLHRLGIKDNTLVIFTSDNGPWLTQRLNSGDPGIFRNGKGTLWEGGVRVPGIIHFPKVLKPKTVNNKFYSTLDVLPSIISLVDPERSLPQDLDGSNFLDELNDEKTVHEKVLYYYHQDQLFAIRRGPLKAHFRSHDSIYGGDRNYKEYDPLLLFNIEQDPGEKFPLENLDDNIIKEFKSLFAKQVKNVVPTQSKIDSKINDNQNEDL
ncbi:sulfatase family protein [Algoriphagus hitonicola]|uniref:Arylsulfatase n=1 Tax=Algoriphagus hitonicola TaxID=435880 RepID=A0A1I2SWU0_9BACT|nr:sulfatase [Algoriphagus hitonicola]SFG57194.1 arylsulfatase [Algoriphagus hitonicola]